MHIAICDDEKVFITRLCSCVKTLAKEYGRECTIQAFDNGKDLIAACRRENFDAVFLDIAMPNTDGFKVAKELNIICPDIGIVFVSDKEKTVYSSYEYSPLWFVPKSELHLMDKAMNKIIKRIEAKEREGRLIPVRIEKNRITEIDLKKTIYVKSEAHYLRIYTADDNKSESFRNNLDDIEKQLSGHFFVRCHSRYLVNCRKISMIESTYCILLNGERVPVSRSKMADTKACFQNYLRSME